MVRPAYRRSEALARFAFGSALVASPACVHYRGHVAVDGRAYFGSPDYAGQASGHGVSMVAEPEFHTRSKSEVHTVTVRPFLRVDQVDPERTHWDLRQVDYRAGRGPWTFGIGTGLFTWGVLENHRQVDVINQTDLVEDIDGGEKLGQPYTSVGYTAKRWKFEVFYLPFFRDRTFPGRRGRLRFPAVVDGDGARFESNWGRLHPNAAARLSLTLGEFDIGLSGFSGLSRDPNFYGQITDPGRVLPSYDLMEQVGVDAQWTRGGFVAKIEAAARWWGRDFRFATGVGGGLEYWFFDLGGKGVDLTLVSEYYFDTRERDLPLTVYQNDVFAGFRLNFSDRGNTSVLGGGMVDVESGFSFLQFETSRRFGDHFRLYFDVRAFVGRAGLVESAWRRDSYGQLRVAYFF